MGLSIAMYHMGSNEEIPTPYLNKKVYWKIQSSGMEKR